MRRPLPVLIALALAALAPVRATGWSNKEHIQLTRLAAERLLADPATPAAMKAWLKRACPQTLTMDQEREYLLTARVGVFPRGVDGLPYWATVPDMVAMTSGSGENERKVEPFRVSERMLHYVDLEYFQAVTERQRYRHDLKNKPTPKEMEEFLELGLLKKPGENDADPLKPTREERWTKAGMLPFRIEQCYAQLVRTLRAKRLVDEPGKFPRDEHAARWAGYLAHYVQDNTQPHHATEDYKSRSYFADKRRAPNVHWDLEGRLLDDEDDDYPELRKEFWDALVRKLDEVEDADDLADLARASVRVSMTSYDALPLIGVAAMRAYGQRGRPDQPEGAIGKFNADKFFHHKGKYQGQEMTLLELKAHQMAWAVKRVQRLWRRAWDEAQQPIEKP